MLKAPVNGSADHGDLLALGNICKLTDYLAASVTWRAEAKGIEREWVSFEESVSLEDNISETK